MKHHRIRNADEEPVGVLFIASPVSDHADVIESALVRAQGEGQIGVFECLQGCDSACEDRVERVLRHHRIDLIVAAHSAYERIRRMRLGHLFADLEALMFAGEGKPDIFSASPGQFGIAGTSLVDSGVSSSAADWLQDPFGGFGGIGGGMGRTGGISIMLGMGGARIKYRDLLGTGEAPPQLHLGANVASGGGPPTTETVRIGGTQYQVSVATNQYGGHDYTAPDGTATSTDAQGNVREFTEEFWGGDVLVSETKVYDQKGRVTEVHRYVGFSDEPNPEKHKAKPNEMEPEETGKDVRATIRKIVEHLRIDQLWEAMLSGRMPPERTDVSREFVAWLSQHNVRDFCHAFEAELMEKDETGYARAYWVSQKVGSRYVRASKWWEYLWNTGAPVDPVGPIAYRSRLATVGGTIARDTGELALKFRRITDRH